MTSEELKFFGLTDFKKKVKYWVKDLYELGFYHVLSVNLLLKLFGFASQLFVAWWLTTEEIGQFGIMQSFLVYVVLLGSLGFNTSTLKLCSEKRPFEEKVLIHRKALKYSFISSFISVVIFLVLNYWGLLVQEENMRNKFSFFLLSAIPVVLNGVDTSYLQALKEFRKLAKVNFIARIITLLMIFLLTYFKGLYGLILANIFGSVILSAIQYRMVIKVNNRVENKIINNSIEVFRLHVNYSFISFLASAIYVASSYIDLLFINYLIKDNPKEVGRYAFVILLISFFTMISESVRQVLIPNFSESSGNCDTWIGIFNKYKKILSSSYFAIAFCSILIIPWAVSLLYGDKFGSIRFLFIIMIFSWFLNSMTSFLSSAIFGAGEVRMNLLCGLIILPVSISVKYIFIYSMGIHGAAIAGLIVALLSVLIYWISFNVVYKQMNNLKAI